MTAEDFTNEMVIAFKRNSIDEFKKKYRSCCDVLLFGGYSYAFRRTRTQENWP
ncbi:MAG: DnaA/Hda family protein [Desulfobacterales bacterium]